MENIRDRVILMNKVLLLLCYLLFAVMAVQSEAMAKELKCTVELQHLNIEPVLLEGSSRSYTVNVSCYIACTHHGESFNKPVFFSKKISPVVVAETEGSEAASAVGEELAEKTGNMRLLQECMANDCGCASKGCSCPVCEKK